jgi:Tfp pilus assembly protein PilN
MRAVNLLPKDLPRTRTARPSAPVIIAAAAPVLAACAVFVGYSYEHSPLAKKERRLDAVKAQVAALPPRPVAASTAGQGLIADRIARRSALDSVLDDRVSMDGSLSDLARILPSDVWLTSLSLLSPTPADATAASASSGLSMSGYTSSQVGVARLMTRLELLPMFTNVALASTTASQIGMKNVVQFSVTATLSPATTTGEGT